MCLIGNLTEKHSKLLYAKVNHLEILKHLSNKSTSAIPCSHFALSELSVKKIGAECFLSNYYSEKIFNKKETLFYNIILTPSTYPTTNSTPSSPFQKVQSSDQFVSLR